jgi:ribosome-associated protein
MSNENALVQEYPDARRRRFSRLLCPVTAPNWSSVGLKTIPGLKDVTMDVFECRNAPWTGEIASSPCHRCRSRVGYQPDAIRKRMGSGPWITMDKVENSLIPESELVFKASRSSGPGGQNVNKLNTRVTALFDVAGSPSLSDEQKQRILSRLSTRINRSGFLHVVSQQHRSQEANRRAAAERLQELVGEALKPRPIRKKTKPSAGARERRLKDKKQRGTLKHERTGKAWKED